MLLVAVGSVAAQETPPSCAANPPGESKDNGAEAFRLAPNKWMRDPVDLQKQQDAAKPSERQARDTFWDHEVGTIDPLYAPEARRRARPTLDFAPIQEEFTEHELRDGVWLTGTFESYTTHLSASSQSVYTEIQFRVARVLGHPKVPGLQAGSLVTIGRSGGTIQAPWGRTVSYEVSPKALDFQPNHTYLLALFHHPLGDFFTFGDRLGLRWDLAGGTAEPDSQRAVGRRMHQGSAVSGLSADDAIDVMTRKLEEAEKNEKH